MVVTKEGEVKDEQEGEEEYSDANPYAYDPNEIQRLLLTPRIKYIDQQNKII